MEGYEDCSWRWILHPRLSPILARLARLAVLFVRANRYAFFVETVRSKKRVAKFGEVFTPPWLVERITKLLEPDLGSFDSRVLEPACGAGNFLVPILRDKLAKATKISEHSEDSKEALYLSAVMSIYGIELLPDNAAECRQRLLEVALDSYGDPASLVWQGAVQAVLEINIVCGDALTMREPSGAPIRFSEWKIEGLEKFARTEYKYSDLLQTRAFGPGTIFESLSREDVFTPLSTQGGLTIKSISELATSHGRTKA